MLVNKNGQNFKLQILSSIPLEDGSFVTVNLRFNNFLAYEFNILRQNTASFSKAIRNITASLFQRSHHNFITLFCADIFLGIAPLVRCNIYTGFGEIRRQIYQEQYFSDIRPASNFL